MEGTGLKRKRKLSGDYERQEKLSLFLDSIIHTIDPFTTNDIEIPLEKMIEHSNNRLNESDCRCLYTDFILTAENCPVNKIADMKRNFNLNWSKHEVTKIQSRFAGYSQTLKSAIGSENI